MEQETYVGGKEASKILGVHQRTLYLWEANGKIDTIRTPGNKRLYNVNKYLYGDKKEINILEEKIDNKTRYKIAYVRVSSNNQKDDLERQKNYMKKRFPNHEIIEDIGSGMNLNKRGIRRIIKLAISGQVEEVVVAYKDRLTRFGYELIEDLIHEYSNGKITVVHANKDIEPEEELVKDVLQIMNIFVAKMNGLRKYKD